MRLLAIETATEACSAALLLDGTISERYQVAPRAHTALILPMIDELLAAAELRPQQLDVIAMGRGPGAFTGVRIAAGVAQGIAFGADAPVIPVSTLAALAQAEAEASRLEGSTILAAIDARMGEVYWGEFRADAQGIVGPIVDERVCSPDVVPAADTPWRGVGTGWSRYGEQLKARIGGEPFAILPNALPRAAHLAQLAQAAWQAGEIVKPAAAQPLYLRNQVARKPRAVGSSP